MREIRDGAAEGSGDGRRVLRGQVHGDEARFVEVDCQPGGRGEVVENFFKGKGGGKVSFTDDQGVISVLENWARARGVKRVMKPVRNVRGAHHPLKDVSNNNEKVGR